MTVFDRTLAVRSASPALTRSGWMVPAAGGIFAGSAAIDALPASMSALGWPALVWAMAGFGVMFLSGRTAGTGAGAVAVLAGAGVWMHSLLEGVAAGAGSTQAVGASIMIAVGLVVHLVPESLALYAVATGSGQSRGRAFARCAVTWLLVVAGFPLVQLSAGAVPTGPLGSAMGLAAGIFTYLAWNLWNHRSMQAGSGWIAALAGVAWVAILHL